MKRAHQPRLDVNLLRAGVGEKTMDGYAMHWLLLLVAAALEITWAVSLKFTHGFTRFWPSAVVIVATAGSVGFLAAAARALPIGTAYAVWTGIGAAGTAIGGMLLFGESASPTRLTCIGLIVIGVVGLKFFGK
jgi:quaternary ammonium compound-resistance protein SugE